MLCRGRLALSAPAFEQRRGMATLKDISMRLKSIKNIQKITKSMKMVAAAKYARADRELRPARPYGQGAQVFYKSVELASAEKQPEHLMILMTSDKGLCGAVHSNIARLVKADMAARDADANVRIVCVGDKSRAQLYKLFGKEMLLSVNEIGKQPPSFEDATRITQAILGSGFDFQQGDVYYNRFKTVVSYATEKMAVFSPAAVQAAPKLGVYDSLDADVLQSYMEYSLASLIYFALKESACSEMSSKMTAMDGASKNAGELIEKLTLHFNRTRQAAITKELIEIISGAAAL